MRPIVASIRVYFNRSQIRTLKILTLNRLSSAPLLTSLHLKRGPNLSSLERLPDRPTRPSCLPGSTPGLEVMASSSEALHREASRPRRVRELVKDPALLSASGITEGRNRLFRGESFRELANTLSFVCS